MLDIDIRIVLQIIGAVLCITNYLLVQTHRLRATQPASLLLVISSCGTLLASALIGLDWGLILLEGTWLVMVSTTLVMRQRQAAAALGAAVPEPTGPAVAAAPVAASAPVPVLDAVLPLESVEPTVPIRVMDPAVSVDPNPTGELQLVGAPG